jgi:SAM-dependent methyltransferase
VTIAVGYADHCRNLFPSLELDVGDLYLLEWHQIAGLSERAPARELAEVLHAHPDLRTFFAARYPPIVEYLDGLLAVHGPAAADALDAAEQLVVWEIAEWIVYQREPEMYDALSVHEWDVVTAIGDIVALDDRVVLDAGAGSGHAAIAACGPAATVFALEPVATLRRYMRDKAARRGIENLFVIDGFLHAVPLPAASVDVLFTCRAIGWQLPAELREVDRVIKPGATAIHLAGMPYPADPNDPLHQALLADGYQQGSYAEGTSTQRKYWKRRDA